MAHRKFKSKTKIQIPDSKFKTKFKVHCEKFCKTTQYLFTGKDAIELGEILFENFAQPPLQYYWE